MIFSSFIHILVISFSAQIFGKVTGNTVFNLLRMGDVDVDANERPVDPIKVLSIEVLWNPFDDIVARDISKLEPVKGKFRGIHNIFIMPNKLFVTYATFSC